ncbi:hypothetical protein FDP41_006223 [Naegleria fowleri]|uniref:Uncharacterized protein n=1 Tax=Naegleria fowleri TaxID=5763 RepID=A0A6A5BP93_NAEFO|nr:uncharacterized protein FDP41_006223 [Naegleria fowleri]KAF0974749.1 hypothetical protein FDP41_006223 [Naegleria fowleri]
MKKLGRVIPSSMLPMKPKKALIVRFCVGENSPVRKFNNFSLNDENVFKFLESFSFVKDELIPKLIEKYHLQSGIFQLYAQNETIEERNFKTFEFIEERIKMMTSNENTNDPYFGGPLFLLDVDLSSPLQKLSLLPLFDVQKAQQGILETKYTEIAKSRPLTIGFSDTTSVSLAHRGISKSSALFRACSIKNKKPEQTLVLDATTGLGKDSCILSLLGFNVICCERHPLISIMLKAALQRARENGKFVNMKYLFEETDSRTLTVHSFTNLNLELPDVIYLDPMFTHVGSALPKYELQVLRTVMSFLHFDESFETNTNYRETKSPFEASLVNWALNLGVKRVVMKRPKKSPIVQPDNLAFSYSDGGDIFYDLFQHF